MGVTKTSNALTDLEEPRDPVFLCLSDIRERH